jgi:hypothetical protein
VPVLDKLPELGTALFIPILLTVLANFIRRAVGVSTSTGGDLILAAVLVDATLLVLLRPDSPLGMSPAAFRTFIIIAAIFGGILFVWSVQLQKALDEQSFCAWANKRRPLKKKFVPETTYPRGQSIALWASLNALLAVHSAVVASLKVAHV